MSRSEFLRQAAMNLLFPPICQICGRRGFDRAQGICKQCLADVKYLLSPICSCCGDQLVSGQEHLCQRCLCSPPPFSLARSIVVYRDPVATLVHRLKYGFDTTTCSALSKIAQSYNFSVFETNTIIIPVPLHLMRLRRRGMNQAHILASIFFKERKDAIRSDILLRNRATVSQTRLDVRMRKRNVRGCFSVKHPEIIRNKQLLLVDDVYTTGATLAECARTLMREGAADVKAITFARVLTPSKQK